MQHVRIYQDNTTDAGQQAEKIERRIAAEMEANPTWRVESINTTIAPESEDYYPVIVAVVVFNDEPLATISDATPAKGPRWIMDIEGRKIAESYEDLMARDREGIPDVATSLAAITGELTGIAETLNNIYRNGTAVKKRD